jgi:adenylosuccinate synthase
VQGRGSTRRSRLSSGRVCAVSLISCCFIVLFSSGPFPTELLDSVGDSLRKIGGEFGTTTGRPRRCGWLDIPVLQYSHNINGYASMNITKLDVLSELKEIKIGQHE